MKAIVNVKFLPIKVTPRGSKIKLPRIILNQLMKTLGVKL